MIRWLWLLAACGLASLVALPVTLAAADAISSFRMGGLGAAIAVQLAHDCSVLLTLLGLCVLTAPAHRLPALAWVALGALALAAAEPLVSVRPDIVASAWRLPRIVGRLSALLFALTAASYLDLLAERPRGRLRHALRLLLGASFLGVAWPLTFCGHRGFMWLARLLGIDARWSVEAPAAFIVEPRSTFARIAMLSAWPSKARFPLRWRAKVLACGATPEAVLFLSAENGDGLPGRYLIQ